MTIEWAAKLQESMLPARLTQQQPKYAAAPCLGTGASRQAHSAHAIAARHANSHTAHSNLTTQPATQPQPSKHTPSTGAPAAERGVRVVVSAAAAALFQVRQDAGCKLGGVGRACRHVGSKLEHLRQEGKQQPILVDG